MRLTQALYRMFLFLVLYVLVVSPSAVTVTPGGGRFGDQLIKYFNAKYVSYYYNIPLIYRPFEYSDTLVLHTTFQKYYGGIEKQFDSIVEIFNDYDFKIASDGNILYQVGIRFKPKIALKNDKKLLHEYQKIIQPIKLLPLLKLPENVITLAVHVRRGDGFDRPLFSSEVCHADKKWPLKFPPEAFYIQEIQRISDLFSDELIYCYVFSDAHDIRSIVKRFEGQVNRSNCVFDFCDQNNYETTTLIDFFNMIRFDCLIRPQSSYSKSVERLGNFKIVVSPVDFCWDNNELVITKSKITYAHN